jgi:hypothetical protein
MNKTIAPLCYEHDNLLMNDMMEQFKGEDTGMRNL